jgi:hypothetical protein
MTRYPAASASSASARPKPLLTPVISMVLVDGMKTLPGWFEELHVILKNR